MMADLVTAPGGTTPHNSEDEISLIRRELRTVDKSILKLHKTRAGLRRRLNGLQSKSCVLASDILSLIFQAACSPPDPDNNPDPFQNCSGTPFILGQVCFRWREVAWFTPQLWTTFVASPTDITIESVTETLDTLRTNACIPFSLKFDFKNITEGRDRIIKHTFYKELRNKIHTLHLESLGDDWSIFFSHHLRRWTKLNDLRINGDDGITSSNKFSLTKASSLRKLSIANFNVRIKLPSNVITTLDMHKLSINICVGLLNQCPNLIIFRASEIGCTCKGTHGLDRNQIVLKHLEDFSWQYYDNNRCTKSLLHAIATPSLRAFSWDAKDMNRTPALPVCHSHIPDSLTTLSLRGIISWGEPRVEEVVKWLSCLEHLRFYGCHESFVKKFLRKLRWSDDQQYIPALRTLTISDNYEPHTGHLASACADESYNVDGTDILKIVKGRFTEGICTSFRFVLRGESMLDIDETTQCRLRKLVGRGFNLEVVSFDGVELLDVRPSSLEEDVDEDKESDGDSEESEEEEDPDEIERELAEYEYDMCSQYY